MSLRSTPGDKESILLEAASRVPSHHSSDSGSAISDNDRHEYPDSSDLVSPDSPIHHMPSLSTSASASLYLEDIPSKNSDSFNSTPLSRMSSGSLTPILSHRSHGRVFVNSSTVLSPEPISVPEPLSLSVKEQHNHDISPFTFPTPQETTDCSIFSPVSPPIASTGDCSSCFSCVKTTAHLCDWENAQWWCKNRHIISGYRKNYTRNQAFMSLFSLHNETCNVWTHLLGLFLFLALGIYRSSDLFLFPPMIRYCFYCFYICVSLCMACSAFFHLTFCIDFPWHSFAYALDMTGIVFCILAQYILGLSLAFACETELRTPYMLLCISLAIVAFTVQHIPWSKYPRHVLKRIIPLLLFASSSAIPYVHFTTFATDLQKEFLSIPAVGAFCLYALGVGIWVSGVPERFFPGKLDNFLTSHGLWHICVVCAAALFEHGLFICATMLAEGKWCPVE